MRQSSRVMILTAILLAGMAVWLPGLRSRRVAAQSPGLMGSYGFTLTQVGGPDLPGALMGVVTFDGAGNYTVNLTIVQVDSDPNANVPQSQSGPSSGTYTVNPDGTGTLTEVKGNGKAPTNIPFVITDGGSGLLLLPTSGFGNHLLTGTARKQ